MPHPRSKLRVHRAAGLALVLALGTSAVPRGADAQAQPAQPSADQLIEHGVQLREQGQDQAALDEFTRAYQRTPSPRARAQMGLAEQALGHWVNAEAYIREALEARSDRWVSTNRRTLERVLPVIGAHLATLELSGGVPGAEVLVGTRSVGTLPLAHPVRVLAGAVVLEVRAAGYQPLTRRFDIAPGTVARESIELVAAPVSTPLVAVRTPAQEGAAPADRTAGAGGSPLAAIGWVGLVGGALLLGGGGVALALRNDAADHWNSDACVVGGMTRMQNCADSLSTGQTFEALSIVGFVAGGALLATGAALLLAAPRSARASTHARGPAFTCAPTLGVAGATCLGTF